jgi:hypothetical protein
VYPTSGNDFEHLANTGVNTPGTMFPHSVPRIFDFPEADFGTNVVGVRLKRENVTSGLPVTLPQCSIAGEFPVTVFLDQGLQRHARNAAEN